MCFKLKGEYFATNIFTRIVCRILFFGFSLLSMLSVADQPAPDFSGPSMHNDTVINLSDYRNMVVYLDFWAAWCSPCRDSLPIYDELRRQVGSSHFEVIAVNIDDPTDDGLEFLSEHPVSYPVIADPLGKIAKKYNIKTMPTSFLIDHKGIIILTKSGFQVGDEKIIKEKVLDLIRKLD